MNGNYNINAKTPLGNIQIKVYLEQKGEKLLGTIETMGMKQNLENGSVYQNQFQFQGDLTTMMGRISYQIHGKKVGDLLEIMVQTNKGNFELQGKKI